MNQGNTVFAQIFSHINQYEFDKCVERYKGNYYIKNFTCWEQFLVMSFAQLTGRESLRDITTCLSAVGNKLYHSGIKSKIQRSTLAEANEKRNWKIYADFAQILIGRACQLYKNDSEISKELKTVVYALDSTTIDLCLSVFPWAKYRKNKGAIKLHTLLNLNGSIPSNIEISNGLCADVTILDTLELEQNAVYLMDRGYIDFERLYRFTNGSAFFVIRAKDNLKFKRVYSNKVDKTTGVQCDQIIKLVVDKSKKSYPEFLRRIKYYDVEKNKILIFLTNNFGIPAELIAELYRQRWQVELFFKWIKQHLKIKKFYGTTANAVYTQIWISVCVYVLNAIIKKMVSSPYSLYKILQIFSISLFEKVSIYQLLNESIIEEKDDLEANMLIPLNF